MSKYTKELKVKLVLGYLSGKSGDYRIVAKKHSILWTALRVWIDQYRFGGLDRLSKELKNNEYTSESKLSVMQYGQINQTLPRETAEYLDIANGATICNWEKKCKENDLSGLEDNRGKPRKNMIKPNKKSKLNTPISKSEEEELIGPREENRLPKVKIIYERELQALLLEEEVEARKRQR